MSKKIIIAIFIICLIIPAISVTSSCTPALEFGELEICSEIDQETAEPINKKEAFSLDDTNFYSTIKVSGVKAEDDYRYAVKQVGSEEVLFDETNKYSTEETGYVEGYFYLEYEGQEGQLFLEPGEYTVDFYHKGDLIDSANFEVLKPEVKILEVSLANEINGETMEPVNITDKFKPEDDLFAAVKVNNNVEGDYFEAKCYYEEGLLAEKKIDITKNYFDDNYVTFTLTNEDLFSPGNYSVEIYYNGSMHGKYDFQILEPNKEEVAGENPFSKGIIYSNEEYNFLFAVPDDWAVNEKPDSTGLNIELTYKPEQIPLGYSFIASKQEEALPESEYRLHADELAESIASEQGWELIEQNEGEYVNANDIAFNDYAYRYNDPEGREWTLIFDFFKGRDSTYIFFVIALKEYYDMAIPIYEGIASSFNYIN